MSIDGPAALAVEQAKPPAEVTDTHSEWMETALTVLFAASAVLFVSFIAVATDLI